MDFWKILNAFINALTLFVIIAIVWAIYPSVFKLLHLAQTLHEMGR